MDTATFEALITEHAQPLARLARRLLPSATDVDDIVQDTFERAWRSSTQLRSDDAGGAWLRTILFNRVRDLGRRHALASFEPLTDLAEVLPIVVEDPYSLIARAEQEGELRAALTRLSVNDRAAIALHDGEGWSAREVATILGCSTDAAHKRIQRGRLALATALAEASPEGPRPELPLSCLTARRAASAYLDGNLGADSQARVDTHLRRCDRCPPVIQALIGIRSALADRTVAESSRELCPGLLDRLRSVITVDTEARRGQA